MDNTPDYLSVLDSVAMKHGGMSNPTYVGTVLKTQWEHFEALARGNNWNIFVSVHADYSGIRRAMCDLVETLYRVPGADWMRDTSIIRAKDADYGGSWCGRGGAGAFFMLARKWDRIAKQLQKFHGDLAEALHTDMRAEGIIDDLGDLRCYLLLVLSWHEATENPKPQMARTKTGEIPFTLPTHIPSEDEGPAF